MPRSVLFIEAFTCTHLACIHVYAGSTRQQQQSQQPTAQVHRDQNSLDFQTHPVQESRCVQGIRGAVPQDLAAIQGLLLPLEERGILAPRSDAQLLSDLRFFRVAERDANVRQTATGCCTCKHPMQGCSACYAACLNGASNIEWSHGIICRRDVVRQGLQQLG